ncbi:MAG: MerR family transcriptional regulator [Lachnospiraceae bacterium]|nr:MerR family transcriptional regulator [Lachnospiraceae bacterium]
MFYTVKDVSEKTSLTPYTIRYYLKEGLFPSIERDSNGTRLFCDTDIETLYMIECMKHCGMTIREIKQYIQWLAEGDRNIDKCLDLFKKKKQDLEEKMKLLTECKEAVDYKVWYYETAKKAGTISVHNSMPADEVPAPMSAIRSRMKHVTRLTNN